MCAHSLVPFLCLNAMWEVVRTNDQCLKLKYIEEYVHSLTDPAPAADETDEYERLERSANTFDE